MFPEKVKTVTVDKLKLELLSDRFNDIPGIPMIEDIGIDCHVSSNPYLPDYVIPGYWLKDLLAPQFLVNINGPHLLYITGIPKAIKDKTERSKFRFNDKLYVSYWEDNNLGYLFQVVNRDICIPHLVRSK